MFKKLRERRFGSLMRIGFLVPQKSIWKRLLSGDEGLLRHPLTLLVAGFILTGGIGGGISWFVATLDASSKAHAAEIVARRTAFDDFSLGLSTWKVRAHLLDRALQYGSAADIQMAEQNYESAYIAVAGREEQIRDFVQTISAKLPEYQDDTDRRYNYSYFNFEQMLEGSNRCLAAEFSAWQQQKKSDPFSCAYLDIGSWFVYGDAQKKGKPADAMKNKPTDVTGESIDSIVDKAASCGTSILFALRPFAEQEINEAQLDYDVSKILRESIRYSSAQYTERACGVSTP